MDNLLDKDLLEVLNHHLLGAEGQGLLLDSSKILLLTDVSQEGDDLISLVNEPFQDGGGVEAWQQEVSSRRRRSRSASEHSIGRI